MKALLLLLPLTWVLGTASVLWSGPVQCSLGMVNCTVTNAYGSFNDGKPCRAANVVFPRTEEELVAAVAVAVKEKRKVKVSTKQSHSFPKLACPGGSNGTIISTTLLDRVVSIDVERKQMTVQSGMLLKDLIEEAGTAGLSLPNSPYFSGITIGGLLATGAHGSSLKGKGGAVHEYVVGLRIVTPTPASESTRFAVVRELGADDPDLNAAKVSLGVLGVISQVTLQLEPLFKRSMTFLLKNGSDADLAELVATWGHQHEFGDIWWLPGHGKVILRKDDRVDVSTPGDGLSIAFRPKPTSDIIQQRLKEEQRQEEGLDDAICGASTTVSDVQHGFDYTNYGMSFTGYPVVGYQHRIQASSSCLDNLEDDLLQTCPWNPRINGDFNYIPALIVSLSNATAFINDALSLRDRNPKAFCDLDVYNGILLRYVKSSSAYLGMTEDSVEFDIAYYRSRAPGKSVLHADMIDELEQIALYKYNALPHWGKSRDYAYNDTKGKYPRLGQFLDVKERFDPDGVFSSEWSDHVLGINGSPVTPGPGCAIQGLCTCTQDSHCAPGYVCNSGKVYPDARVCTISQPQEG